MKDLIRFLWRRCAFFPCLFIHALLFPPATHAQLCTGALISYTQAGNSVNQSQDVCGTFCHTPILSATEFTVTPPGCDPKVSACAVTASTAVEYPGNHQNFSAPGFSWATLILTDVADGFIGQCGTPFAAITQSLGTATFGGSFSCADLEADPTSATFKLKAISCFMIGCEMQTIGTIDLSGALDCTEPAPPLHGCGEGACGSSCFGPGGGDGGSGGGGGGGAGGSSAVGGGPGVSPAGGGPGARLRYQAGGAGSADLPTPAGWSLGRGWSHDYALAIVEDPDASHVWLITEFATYREFTDGNGDNHYETVAPSDEYRTLEKVVSGWTLTDLDGTVIEFDGSGSWLSTADRNGNTKLATYSVGQLSLVDFPDGRSETFSYHPDGKLDTLTEVGVDGITSRTWSYTWLGDDLERLGRPDGTVWRFEYIDPAHPSFMTGMVLVGTDASERILGAWEYDALGNVIHTWKGAATFEDVSAVEKWSFSFDNAQLPTETMITDPLGNTMTYFFGYDPASDKPRLEQTTGNCPACGLGPNSQLFYEDPANPLRRTRRIDGRGITTLFTYDVNGGSTSRIEAFGTPLERETTWTFDLTWPSLIATVEKPSVEGFPNVKLTTMTYDASGNLDTRTVEGFENGIAFSYLTDFVYNTGGQVATIDPPGFGTADQTTFAYDPTRGNGLLVLESRTDPIIGTSVFGYDAFNRRTSVTDVNGVVTETQYDTLDRVTLVVQRGATIAEDLVTEYRFDVFGGLIQIVFPAGNVVEYSYDSVGRLATKERKPNDQVSSHGERVVYTYDGNSNRVLEEQEGWDGAAWVKRSQTEFTYTTRCQLGQITHGFGGDEATTEMTYDCNGNLERVWDANHPSSGQTVSSTSESIYDDLKRLTELRQPFGGTGGGISVTAYGYDVQDHLKQITDAEGTITAYIFSDRDLLTEESSEVSGTTALTYTDHGGLATHTDARGITKTLTVDELDRVTFVDYPDDSLDIVFTYDDPGVPFALGRLTSIERGGSTINLTNDRFGRQLQDGDLKYGYDQNGNRTEVEYPGGVKASYTYDYANRQETLTVEQPGEPDETVVMAASYEPAGPLATLTLGNGLLETRGFDTRYYPTSIVVDNAGSPVFDWQYSTDAEGNVTNILDSLDSANHRAYFYQDYQYFLTQGDGPWGAFAWTYDKTGNRLSETRGGVTDIYGYVPNSIGGNSAQLQQILLGTGGVRTFGYDPAGDQNQVDNAGDATERTYDSAGRLARQERTSVQASTDFMYDGRSFLLRAIGRISTAPGTGLFCDGFESGDTAAWGMGRPGGECFEDSVTESIYGSQARLHGIKTGADTHYIFYFGERPVVLLASSIQSLSYLVTDHLGTPAQSNDSLGVTVWSGGFEPFGADYSGAGDAGIFLRFPGQWEDGTWAESNSGGSTHYNMHRWYGAWVGQYITVDPEWSENVLAAAPSPLPQAFGYANQQPLRRTDELGLRDIIPMVSPKCRKQFPDEPSFKDFLREVERAARRSQDAPPCKSNPGRPKKVRVKCGSCFGQCGYSGLLGGMCVNIGQNRNGQCGQGRCLGSTVFHEFIHQCGGDQAMAFGCEKIFYGDECRFTIPENFKKCINPCKE